MRRCRRRNQQPEAHLLCVTALVRVVRFAQLEVGLLDRTLCRVLGHAQSLIVLSGVRWLTAPAAHAAHAPHWVAAEEERHSGGCRLSVLVGTRQMNAGEILLWASEGRFAHRQLRDCAHVSALSCVDGRENCISIY